jgi:threonine 3-dehydrogenase
MIANDRMLALRKPGPQAGVELAEVPLPPAPGPGQVIVEVAAAGICGSDLHIDEWTSSYDFLTRYLPVTLGHEFAGHVSATGPGVTAWRIGDAVTVKPSAPCGTCPACEQHRPDDCTRRSALGLHENGGFARFVAAPASQLLALPPGLDPELGALVEPLSICANAIARGEIGPGHRVAVFGPGTIGQGCALFARRAGANVTVIGMNDAPRFAVLRAMGFENLIDLATPDADSRLREIAGDGFDIAIEAAGTPSAVRQALACLRLRGTMVAVGIHAGPVPVDLTTATRRELRIQGSARGDDAIWRDTIAALAENPALFAPMITHRLKLSDAVEGFAMGHRKEASKILLLP